MQGALKQKRGKEVGSKKVVPVYVPVKGKPEKKRGNLEDQACMGR